MVHIQISNPARSSLVPRYCRSQRRGHQCINRPLLGHYTGWNNYLLTQSSLGEHIHYVPALFNGLIPRPFASSRVPGLCLTARSQCRNPSKFRVQTRVRNQRGANLSKFRIPNKFNPCSASSLRCPYPTPRCKS